MYKRLHRPYIKIFSNSTNESKVKKKRICTHYWFENTWKGHYQTQHQGCVLELREEESHRLPPTEDWQAQRNDVEEQRRVRGFFPGFFPGLFPRFSFTRLSINQSSVSAAQSASETRATDLLWGSMLKWTYSWVSSEKCLTLTPFLEAMARTGLV